VVWHRPIRFGNSWIPPPSQRNSIYAVPFDDAPPGIAETDAGMNGLPGARESNAGDDFHVLWAARRVLGLLDPKSNLELVAMEELFPYEGEINPKQLLGVDLTEYFGARDFESANQVVVSQLKYSHRNPHRNWTVARLNRSSRRPSVTKRLADIYKGLAGLYEREHLLDVLKIRLVSNMPLGARLSRSLAAAQDQLADAPGRLGTATLLAALPDSASEDIGQLQKASGLGSYEFTDFLRILDLDLGQPSRFEQELSMTGTLGRYVKADLEHHSRALYELVRKRAEPEGVDRPIAREDVLAALGVPDPKKLLPAPSVFESKPKKVIATTEPERIAATVRANERRTVIAHGDAGVGKTTTVTELKRALPEGSVVVTLDCYAGGDYLKPAHARHLPQRALMQLTNGLAVACRLPLLLTAPRSTEDMWLELEQRLAAAAESLRAVGAEVVIVIDAIDNAAWAAQKRGDPSFVTDLWQLKVPVGAGLVATARTARLDLLAAPADTERLRLRGFDQAESATHFRQSFPEADDEAAREFHERSEGNPRVQTYVLDLVASHPEKGVSDAVALAKRTPENIFEDLWSAAEQIEGDAWALARLADLMCLTAPIEIERLEEVADPDDGSADRFCHALAPGLRIESSEVTIKDEDFEKFLADKLTEDGRRAAHGRLADLFSPRAHRDAYAAGVLAEHLFGAGREEELISLVIDGGQPEAIEDPLSRLQAYLRRVRLALRCSAGVDQRLQAAKLLGLAALSGTTDAAITKIIRDRPDLALRYGDPDAVSTIWRDDESLEWQGPVHMRLAAIAARKGEKAEAEEQLRATDAWLVQRREKEKSWEISAADLSAAMEALYLIADWKRVLENIQNWRPWSFVWETAEELMRRLREYVPRVALRREVFGSDLPPQIKARLLVALRCEPGEIPQAPLLRLARSLSKEPTRSGNREGSWPTDFAELVAQHTGKPRLVVRLLDALEPALPNYAPSQWHGTGDFIDPLRCRALRAACRGRRLEIEELMPESTKEKEDEDYKARQRRESERSEMHKNVEPLIPIYTKRARALLGRPMAHSIAPKLSKEIESYKSASQFEEHTRSTRYSRWVPAMCELLILARGAEPGLVEEAIEASLNQWGSTNLHIWKRIAATLLPDPRYREQALGLIDGAAVESEKRAQPASELTEFLLELSEVADLYDRKVSADLYERAVNASSGLDDDGIVTLEQHARLAPHLASIDRADTLAQRVGQVLVSYRPRVSDEDYLPWRQTLQAVTELSPRQGIAMASRWEDSRYVRIENSIADVVMASVDSTLLTTRDGMALLALMDERVPRRHDLTALLDRIASEGDPEQLVAQLEQVSMLVRRDLLGPTRRDTARALKEWASDHGLTDSQAVKDVDVYCQYPAERRSTYESAPYRREERKQEHEDLLRRAAKCGAKGFDAFSAEAARDSWGDVPLREVLDAAADGISPSQRLKLLEAIEELSTEHTLFRFHSETAIRFLGGLLEKWSGNGAVRRWRDERLRKLLVKQLPNLSRYRETNEECMLAVSELVGPEVTADLAVAAATGGVERFRPDALHALARFVVDALPPEQQADYLEWSLKNIEDDEPTPDRTIEASTRAEILAALLWVLFANPDKRVRWRAAHAGRSLMQDKSGGSEVAGRLLELLKTRGGGGFSDPNLQFYWMAGQTWALMTLARIASEHPEVIAPHARHLAEIALDRNWPHALVRHYARSAALSLAEQPGCEFDRETIEQLELTNQPANCWTERGPRYGLELEGAGSAKRWRFGMDTEDAWFQHLGEQFKLNKGEIAHRAERWLIDRLGESPEMEPRRGDVRIESLEYGLIDNHHGSNPRVETPRLTLEYNALQLVAGELADERRRS
jgi:hypothetical protein